MTNKNKRRIFQLFAFIFLILLIASLWFLEANTPHTLRRILLGFVGVAVIGTLAKMLGDIFYYILEERKTKKRLPREEFDE